MLSKAWFCILLIVCLGITSYSFMLSSPFKTGDDTSSIITNKLIQSRNHLSEIFTTGYFKDKFYYRPLVNLSFMEEYQHFGLNSFFYNLDNLILHILNALLVWGLVASLMQNATLGFWVAILFVIHPIQAEAVNNISGRAILLSASFGMISTILFLKFQDYPRKIFLILSCISFSLALLCKESAGVLPVVLALMLWFKKKPIRNLVPFFVIIFTYIAWRYYLGITQTFPWHNGEEAFFGFSTFLRSVLTHLKLLILPVGLYFDRSQRLFLSVTDVEFLMTMAVWLTVIVIAWKYRSKMNRLTVFLIGWVCLELLPVSQLVTAIGVSAGRISSADHFLYLASIPIFISFVVLTSHVYRMNLQKKWFNPLIFKGLIAGFLILFFMMNIEQNIYASHEMSMLTRSAEYEPLNGRIQSALGLLYAKKGDYKEAQNHFLWAVRSNPESARYRISLAQSICDQGRYEECLKIYNEIDMKDVGSFASILDNNKKEALRLMNEHNAQILPK